jgi:hypothetical protein
MDSIEVRKFSYLSPPRAFGAAGPPGQVMVIPVTTAAAYLSLSGSTFGVQYAAGLPQNVTGVNAPAGAPQGLMGVYITIFADGADLGIIVGSTAALVSAGNAPVLANAGSVTAGVYTGTAGTCHRIISGTERRYLTQIGQDIFLGYVGSTTGNMRIFQSSGYGIEG